MDSSEGSVSLTDSVRNLIYTDDSDSNGASYNGSVSPRTDSVISVLMEFERDSSVNSDNNDDGVASAGSFNNVNDVEDMHSMDDESVNENHMMNNQYDNVESDEDDYVDYSVGSVEDEEPTLFTALQDMFNDQESNEIIRANFVVNPIEVILAILKFSTVYSLPFMAVVDLCKMFNTFLDSKVIPATAYLLDKLFYPPDSIIYHAVCPTCKVYIRRFNRETDHSILCHNCQERVNLKHPLYRDFFITFDIKSEIQNLLQSNADYYTNVISQREEAINNIEYQNFFDGSKYKEFVRSLAENKQHSYVTTTLNSDGSPVFKSSKFSLWPIQLMVNELPQNIRNEKPIIYGLWFGHDKPNMTYFLNPFVEDMNFLSDNGIACTLNNERRIIYPYAVCCCVDSVARAPMQGLTQFNGRFGCSWCLHEGEEIWHQRGTARKYTLTHDIIQRRNKEDTERDMEIALQSNRPVNGIKKVSPLINLQHFDIIDSFVPDFMHCINLGVVKKFSEYWFNTSNKPFSIQKPYIDQIAATVQSFKVPTQLCRLSRSVDDRKYWKSKEWESWLLYYSLPVLSQVPGFEVYLRHWALLVEAAHILLRESISIIDLQRSQQLLDQFVTQTQEYYTADAMTYNVHQLTHIVHSVRDWGPLWSHCGYPFESGNGKIKNMVHAAKGVLNQVCRNVHKSHGLQLLQSHVSLQRESAVLDYCNYLENRDTRRTDRRIIGRYFGRQATVNRRAIEILNLPNSETTRAYHKMVKDQCLYKSRKGSNNCYRSNNSYAQLQNGDYIVIIQFIVDELNNREYTVYKLIEVNLFNDVCTNVKQVVRIHQDIHVTDTIYLKKLCVCMRVNDLQFISAVTNMYWQS